jgi:dihydroflavonol-4-reductase
MRMFVTGGTGFIGTHLVKRLAQTDHALVCLARPTSDARPLREVGATVVTGDVTDKESLLEGMEGCDWLVHLASSFLFWVPNRQVYEDVNIKGTRNVMEAALQRGISKVVHVSTAAVYGNAEWPIREETPVGHVNPSEYGRTKYAGDLIAWQLYEEKGLPLVVLYPGAVVGANDPKAAGRYVKNFALGRMPGQVLTGSMFPWVHVRDVCEAILRALEKVDNIGQRYLLTGENLTFGDINKMISKISGVRLPLLVFPDFMTLLNARLLTRLADLIKKPPLLDMSIDQMRLMHQGCMVDGSKAQRELGLTYTPIRTALEEAIVSFGEAGATESQEHVPAYAE